MITLMKQLAAFPLLALLATSAPALDFPKYEKVTKGNTTVLLMKQERVPLVSIRVTIEYEKQEGIDMVFSQAEASLYLHSIKYGSGKYPGEKWLKTLEATGAELQEGVDPNTILLSTEVRKEDAGLILDLFLDGMLDPNLTPEKVDQERSRQIAELESAGDQPNQIASDAIDLAYFGKDHPYGANPLGTPLTMKSAVVNNKHMDCTFITSGKLVVVLAGDINSGADEILTSVDKKIETNHQRLGMSSNYCIVGDPDTIKGGKSHKPEQTATKKVTPRRVVIVNLPESQQTQVRLMIAGPTDIYSPLRLAAIPLGGSFTSRLVDELRVKRGLTYSASSRMNQRKLASVFTISSFTKVPSTEEFLKVLFEELNKAKKPGLTEEEISRGKALYKGEAPQRWERYSGLAAILEDVELRGLPADYPLESINHVEKNTKAEAQAALNAALDLDHYVLVLAGPAARLKPIAAKYGVVEVWEKKQVIEP